ncbi:MAG TPA: hypothetical protein VFA04_23175 [Bryobacteraceae bacterium]|nr:hypothetical protein [Bryobacteraceae bacterium]
MKHLVLTIATAGLALMAGSASRVPDAPQLPDLKHIERELTEITGLQFKHDVPAAFMNRDQLKRYLDEQVRENAKPKDLHATEVTLKLLGLVPADFDLRRTTVDLLTEQAEAFYDYHRRRLYLVQTQGGNQTELEMALAHELSHALADQHFDLKRFMKTRNTNDDEAMARMAVMEGQASWLMAAYASKKLTGTIMNLTRYFDPSAALTEQVTASYPVFAHAPLYVRESLVFPYAEGMRLEQALYQRDGKSSFTEVFEHPPASTQQVIHPDRYERGGKPQLPDAPKLPAGYRRILEGTLGEFDYRVLLGAWAERETADKAAAHLIGSTYCTGEDKRSKADALSFASTWDSPASAQRFLDLYGNVLERKAGPGSFTRQTMTALDGRNGAGWFHVEVNGATVRAIEGAPGPLQQSAKMD